MNDYLLFGPVNEGHNAQIGGSTALFQLFVNYLKRENINFKVVAINKVQGCFSNFINLFYIFGVGIFYIPRGNKIILNFNNNGMLYVAPFLFLLSKMFQKIVALRFFGGNSIEILNRVPCFYKFFLLKVYKNVDYIFCETINEVNYFKKLNSSVYWFPNCREFEAKFRHKEYRKRIIFIGQVKKSKGVEILISVIKQLENEYELKIYGPILDKELKYLENSSYYKGVITSSEVVKVLDENDLLVLPTYHEGEGYPGVIIEAYSRSVPVIATNWNAIHELVLNNESGYLIQPNSTVSLKEAILKINAVNYRKLCEGAFLLSHNFQSFNIHARILEVLK